jgi:hypothetical protein
LSASHGDPTVEVVVRAEWARLGQCRLDALSFVDCGTQCQKATWLSSEARV